MNLSIKYFSRYTFLGIVYIYIYIKKSNEIRMLVHIKEISKKRTRRIFHNILVHIYIYIYQKTQVKNMCTYIQSGLMREGFSRYIGPGPGEPTRGFWISEGPHSLTHRRLILIFWFFFFQLFLFYLKKNQLYKIHFLGGPKQVCSALQNFHWRSCI